MTPQTLEQDLLDLERRYWQAMKDKDVDGALALTDEPCFVTGAQGVGRVDRQGFAAMMENATWTIDAFAIGDDAQVRMLSDDAAILAYTVREQLEVDGAPLILDVADASTWIRRGDRWLCAMHSESILGDPFGRDRS